MKFLSIADRLVIRNLYRKEKGLDYERQLHIRMEGMKEAVEIRDKECWHTEEFNLSDTAQYPLLL